MPKIGTPGRFFRAVSSYDRAKDDSSLGGQAMRIGVLVGSWLVAVAAMVALTPLIAAEFQCEVPAEQRRWYRNPDGSCVQCSIGMSGVHMNVPSAYTLLWDTEYGHKERGGSYPSRVSNYAKARGIPIYNVTGSATWEWMRWAARTHRYAAIGAGSAHFQSLWGWETDGNRWFVCNNNSPSKIDEYSWAGFQRLHRASGEWIVVIDKQPPPVCPRYIAWWQ